MEETETNKAIAILNTAAIDAIKEIAVANFHEWNWTARRPFDPMTNWCIALEIYLKRQGLHPGFTVPKDRTAK
jgi:hypothetical protein